MADSTRRMWESVGLVRVEETRVRAGGWSGRSGQRVMKTSWREGGGGGGGEVSGKEGRMKKSEGGREERQEIEGGRGGKSISHQSSVISHQNDSTTNQIMD